ncbi:MAG: DNA repair protein RecN (Recombination protein N) [Planctomycetota bacterium]|jgi:DNA repair protein RecN (Recombination protein N)
MLTDISIRDLALFESAELEYGEGLNVITGQTGAGKSLALRALELLLGQKPRTQMVREGASGARVEGRFVFVPGAAPDRLIRFLREDAPGVLEDWDGGAELELVLTRSLTREGRTRAHLNQRPVTQRFLRELASMLVEIHGQNDHQRLLEPAEQRVLLDTFGGLEKTLGKYQTIRDSWIALGTRYFAWADEETARHDRLDLLRFQVGELGDAQLSVEELADLRRECDRLRYAEELLSQVGGALSKLAERDGSALDVLRESEALVERWEERVEDLQAPASELREATAHLELATQSLHSFLESVEYSPERLAELEQRLREIEDLERKYRSTVAELLERLPELEEELAALEGGAQGLEECAGEWATARKQLEKSAAALTKARRKLCEPLESTVGKSLAELGLERARFEVKVESRAIKGLKSPNVDEEKAQFEGDTRRFAAEGADEIEFLLAANPGEGMSPLRKVASGGEAARFMLALRGALAARQTIPTLIFDEVDAGVGGRLAPKVGRHLQKLGEHYQILCITHLPAVAAAAHVHLEVEKSVVAGRTTTCVRHLAGADRVRVIADMIAGGGKQATALAEAERLLGA